MSRPIYLRSGSSTTSINTNLELLNTLLAELVDATPVSTITSLTIDCNGHDLINLGPEVDGGLALDP